MDVDIGTVLVVGSAVGAAVSAGLAVSASRNGAVPGAGAFGWLMVAATGWCLLNVAWLTTAEMAVADALFPLTELTSASIVSLWVVFALTYTGRREWLTPARLVALLLVPNLYALLALTNPIHGLVIAGTALVTQNGQTAFVAQTGLAHTAQMAASVAFVAAGYALFGEFLLRSRNLYRKQTFVILTAGLATAGVQGLFVLGLTPHPGLDATPLTFAFNGLLVGLALFRYDFLSVTPLAGDLLVDELPDPVLVLDTSESVIDCNAAAVALFDQALDGRQIDEIAPGLQDSIRRGELLVIGEDRAYYDPQTSSIADQYGAMRGQLVVLRDVTDQHRRQNRLEALQAATQQFIEADQPETVVALTVQFVVSVLDRPVAGVFLRDGDRLEPTAVSDAIEAAGDGAVPPIRSGHPLWRAYEGGERTVIDLDGTALGSLGAVRVLPLGDHGVVVLDTDDGPEAAENEQYTEILVRTTQVALEQVRRERELRASQTSVERRNEQIEFFNSVLRHSLRNAMLVVEGRAEHLRSEVDDEQNRHLDSIITWSRKLSEMSETIRDINETMAASESERLESVELGAMLRRAVESVVPEDGSTTVELDVDDSERVHANHLAEQVFISVVENAIEHNTNPEPRVEITTRGAGDWKQIRIADNGPGISDELKTTVFERSIAPSQTAGGFGLYFVSVMMELYGGKVWYEDNHPSGTVAVLEFQRTDGDTPAVKAQTNSPEGGYREP